MSKQDYELNPSPWYRLHVKAGEHIKLQSGDTYHNTRTRGVYTYIDRDDAIIERRLMTPTERHRATLPLATLRDAGMLNDQLVTF